MKDRKRVPPKNPLALTVEGRCPRCGHEATLFSRHLGVEMACSVCNDAYDRVQVKRMPGTRVSVEEYLKWAWCDFRIADAFAEFGPARAPYPAAPLPEGSEPTDRALILHSQIKPSPTNVTHASRRRRPKDDQ